MEAYSLHIDQTHLRRGDQTSMGSRLVACSENLLLAVLQDAPQHARRVMKTLRELHGEAQHVVEEHSVDGSMDEEEACEKDVEMDEEEGTYMAAVRQYLQRCLPDAVPAEDKEEGSRLLVDIDDGESTEVVVGHDAMLSLGCTVLMANVAEKVVAAKA